MADNPYKREIANMAISILREGRRSDSSLFFDAIDDTEFADWSTATVEDIQQVCLHYPIAIKETLREIKPDFAKQYADLLQEIRINKEIADYNYLFQLPDDFLDMVRQIDEADRTAEYDHKIMVFDSYAHVVAGTDDQAWKCIVEHTASTDDKPITGANYATNWELYNTDGGYGAAWVNEWEYKAAQSGKLLATGEYSNDDGDSAYIEYIPHVQAGINDKPQYYTDEFKLAVAVRLATKLTGDIKQQIALLQRYDLYDKPKVLSIQKRYIPPKVSILDEDIR